ncbi:MAG TPA: hypothetical protein HA364_07995, partial [Thermoplasmata archaeon]|nr:hypothetical protein [Thermoplasmata archaeon]
MDACISVSVSVVFAISLLFGVAAAKTESATSEIVSDDAKVIADWSVLVYLVADNDLDPYTETDLQELKDGDSSELVNSLVLVDRLYEPAYLYCVEDNELVLLKELGE